MPRTRKRTTLWPWSHKYVRHQSDLTHNYRMYFLKCVERKTPEVVADLARNLLPLYKPAFLAELSRLGERSLEGEVIPWPFVFRKATRDHPLMIETAADEPRRLRAVWEGYLPVEQPLREWAEKYQLRNLWVLVEALNALLVWSCGLYEHFSDPGLDTRWTATARMRPSRQGGIVPPGLEWPVRPILAALPLEPRQFDYESWNLEDVKGYRRKIQARFKAHLDSYEEEIRTEVKTLRRLKPLSKPERFEMLALYLCRRMTAEEIAKIPGFAKDPSGIFRDVQQAARLLALPLIGSKRTAASS